MKAVKIVVGVLCVLFAAGDFLACWAMRANQNAAWGEVVVQGSVGALALAIGAFLLEGAFAKPKS